MKKKLFMLLALVMTTMTASAVAGYTLSVGTSEHGTIAFTDKNGQTIEYAAEGDKVTVTITPTTGYVVNQPSGQWYAAVAKARTRADIDLLKDVELTSAGQNTWTFTMARANVEISATYKKLLTNQDITVDDIAAQTYTASAIEPTITVKDGTTTLTKDTDYTVAYSDNVNAGTATVTITAVATSEDYAGETTKTFTIDQVTLTAATLTETNFTYNQQEQTAEVASVSAGTLTVPAEGYDISGNTATTVGNYTATITGKGNFKGQVTAQYSIIAANAQLFDLTLDPTEFTYNGQEQKPAVTVKDGDATLVEGTDYDLTFTDAVNAGTVTVTATGKGNYTGTQTATFTINPAELTEATLAETSLVYNLQLQIVGVSSVKADTLDVPESDYEVTGNSGTNVGTYTVTVTGKNNFTGEVTAQFSIVAADAPEVFDLTLESAVVDADGTAKMPAVIVKDGDATLVEGTDYTVSYSGNVKVGTATVIVTGQGNYEGTTTAQFAIVRDLGTVFSAGSGWATYVAQEDLALPEGVKAYTVSGATTTEVTAESVGYIPAGVGVLLNRSDVGQADFKGYAYEGTKTAIESVLVGSATAETGVMAYRDFVLYGDEFVLSGTASVAAAHAYLPAASAPAGVRRLSIVAGGGTTGISTTNATTATNGEFYDLNGRKLVGKPAKKGVYILNGKKVVVK